MDTLKKVGIVIESYKIPKYVHELSAKGFTVGAIFPCTNSTVSITLKVEESQVQEIAKLCNLLEHQFKTN